MFNFLKLPRELRDKIYEYALIHEGTVVAEARIWSDKVTLRTTWTVTKTYEDEEGTFDESQTMSYSAGASDWYIHERRGPFNLYRRKWHPPVLNLLAANQQIYAEAAPVFYGQNIFHFAIWQLNERGLRVCRAFMSDRSQLAQRSIRHIYLYIRTEDYRIFLARPEFSKICDELCKNTALHTIEIDLFAWHVFGVNLEGLKDCNASQFGLAEFFKSKGLRKLVIRLASSRDNNQMVKLTKELRADWLGGLRDTMTTEDLGNKCARAVLDRIGKRPLFPEHPAQYGLYYCHTVVDLQEVG